MSLLVGFVPEREYYFFVVVVLSTLAWVTCSLLSTLMSLVVGEKMMEVKGTGLDVYGLREEKLSFN